MVMETRFPYKKLKKIRTNILMFFVKGQINSNTLTTGTNTLRKVRIINYE